MIMNLKVYRRNDRGLNWGTISIFGRMNWGESRENLLSLVGVSIEIRTVHPQIEIISVISSNFLDIW
jgi:hypothetical protein